MRLHLLLSMSVLLLAAGSAQAEQRPSVAIVVLGEVNLDRAQSSRIGDRLGDAPQSEFGVTAVILSLRSDSSGDSPAERSAITIGPSSRGLGLAVGGRF